MKALAVSKIGAAQPRTVTGTWGLPVTGAYLRPLSEW